MSWLDNPHDEAFLRTLATGVFKKTVNDNERKQVVERLEKIADRLGRHPAVPPQDFDPVARPEHYAKGGIEHIATYEAKCAGLDAQIVGGVDPMHVLSPGTQRFLGGMEYAAVTMLWRAGEKPYTDAAAGLPAAVRDWGKAAWYINRGIVYLKKEIEKRK